jgi:hypothetical protein
MPQVVNLKPRQCKRTQRDVPLDQTSGASRFFRKMIADIESDLGGRRYLSRIEGELIRAFAGAATTLQYLNVQVALGDTGEIDLAGYATMASTMLRIGSRLGLSRRSRDVTPSLDEYLRLQARDSAGNDADNVEPDA